MAKRDSFDFFSPFVTATIVTEEEKRYPLWVGPIDDTLRQQAGLSIPHLAFVQSVTVEMQLGYIPIITVVLAPTYHDGLAFLNSTLVEFGTSLVEVQFGYTNALGDVLASQVYSGLLLPPDVQISGSEVHITLHGQGVGGFGMIRQTGEDSLAGKTRKQVIDQLVAGAAGARAGLTRVDYSLVTGQVNTSRTVTSTSQRGGRSGRALQITQGLGPVRQNPPNAEIFRLMFDQHLPARSRAGKTDWQFIDELCQEAICTYAEFPEDDERFRKAGGRTKIVIIPKPTIYASDPQIILSMFDLPGQLGPDVGVYPILSASSPQIAVFAPAGIRGEVMSGIRSGTKEIVTKAIGDPQVKPDRSNKGGAALKHSKYLPGLAGAAAQAAITAAQRQQQAAAAAINQAGGSGRAAAGRRHASLVAQQAAVNALQASASDYTIQDQQVVDFKEHFYGDVNDPNLVSRLKSDYIDMAAKAGCKLDIETLGVPNILPAHTVRVQGLSSRFDSIYTVFKCIHTFGSAGSTTKLEMYANASLLMKGQLEPKGKVAAQNAAPAVASNNSVVQAKAT